MSVMMSLMGRRVVGRRTGESRAAAVEVARWWTGALRVSAACEGRVAGDEARKLGERVGLWAEMTGRGSSVGGRGGCGGE